MATGIFFHYQEGERLRDFPQALDGILNQDPILFFDAFYPQKARSAFELDPLALDTLRSVHSPSMIERVQATGDFEGALYSASGTLAAAVKVWAGEIQNAFVFTGYGDHHAGRDFFGGGCYFNGAAIAVAHLKKKGQAQRLAVIDTDAHHGNGSWDLFQENSDVLYICFCPDLVPEINRKVNITVPVRINDDEYLKLARVSFERHLRQFQPEIIFWNWGYDGTVGDYGDQGLTPEVHRGLAEEIKKWADELCQGRLVVVLCGGSRRDLARILIPRLIRILADLP